MTTERIDVIVTEKGGRVVKRSLDDIAASADRGHRQISLMQKALGLFGSGLIVRNILNTANSFTTLQNRLRLTDQGAQSLTGTWDGLLDISERTHTAIQGNVALFQRASFAQDELNATTAELFQFTEASANALRIQGGAASESAGAMLQLSQALSSGRVQAEEWNSIVEGMFPLAKAAAEGFDEAGGSVGKFKQLIAEGKVSSRAFFEAVLEQSGALQEKASRAIITVTQAVTDLQNAWLDYVGNADQAVGATRLLVEALGLLADNLDIVVPAVAGLVGIAVASAAFSQLAAAIAAVNAVIPIAVAGIGTLTTAIGLLTIEGGAAIVGTQLLGVALAALATPLGLVAIAVGAGVLTWTALNYLTQDATTYTNEYIDTLDRLNREVQTNISLTKEQAQAKLNEALATQENIVALINEERQQLIAERRRLDSAVSGGKAQFSSSFFGNLDATKAAVGVQQLTQAISENSSALGEAQLLVAELQSRIDAFSESVGDSAGLTDAELKTLQSAFRNLLDSVDPVGAALREIADAEALLDKAIANGLSTTSQKVEILEKLRLKLRDNLDPLGAVNRELARERELLGLSVREREVHVRFLELEEELRRLGVVLTEDQTASLIEELEALRQLNEETRVRDQLVSNLIEPYRDLQTEARILSELLEKTANDDVEAMGRLERALEDTGLKMIQLRLQLGEGTFADGFINEIARITEAARNMDQELGSIFGSTFDQMSQGIGRAVADLAVYHQSWDDFGQAIRQLADQILANLIQKLVELGIQMLLNKLLGETLGAAATAATVAQASAAAAAWAPAAAMASLATVGANAAPAAAAHVTTTTLAQALAAIPGLKDGGEVVGPGTGTSDSVLRRLSNGEFVVNARATNDNRQALLAMNAGAKFTMGGQQQAPAPQVNIKSVTVMDPEAVLDVMDTPAGEQLIINTLERNPDLVKRILSR